MSSTNNNIWEVTTIIDLASILRSQLTVILGLVLPLTPESDKVMIRKFLKEKSKKFSQITFIYMIVPKESMGKLGIINSDPDTYPLIYHIRDGNNILVAVERADIESIYGSFKEVENYYIEEMKEKNKSADNKSTDVKTKNTKHAKSLKNEESFGTDSDEEQLIDADEKVSASIQSEDNVIDPDILKEETEKKAEIDKKAETEKKAEKIVYLENEYEKHHIKFLKEVQKRKKMEQSINKGENEIIKKQ